ncbi:hypothetical protein BRADO5395 [Bradyrhizobium sp. ORS 278]|nr:hypothetical protein BRADO5395 [Bradyrhizobium sp. ORS 278]
MKHNPAIMAACCKPDIGTLRKIGRGAPLSETTQERLFSCGIRAGTGFARSSSQPCGQGSCDLRRMRCRSEWRRRKRWTSGACS